MSEAKTMIQQLIGHISESQIEIVVNTIMDQYRRYKRLVSGEDYQIVFSVS